MPLHHPKALFTLTFVAASLLVSSRASAAEPPPIASTPAVTATRPPLSVSGDATFESQPRLRLEKSSGRATVEFNFAPGKLDLSAFRDLAIKVRNESHAELDVLVTALSDLETTYLRTAQGRFLVSPAETNDLRVLMHRPSLGKDHPYVKRLGNLYGFPTGYHRHWQNLHTDSILRVSLRINWIGAQPGEAVDISSPFGLGDFSADPAKIETLEMPLMDDFGQLRVGNWPGKVLGVEELASDAKADLALIETHTRPAEKFSRFGGYLAGPRLKATGFFRVEKVDGKWWFVDPEGHLFWSHGVNTAGNSVETRIEGREELFPERLRGEKEHRFHVENMQRKFGEQGWIDTNIKLTVARMHDWGLNTIGAWSKPELYAAKAAPYTLIVHTDLPGIGAISKMVDPFSEQFRASLDQRLGQLAASHAQSPWLVGVFIENELDWRGGVELANQVLRSGPKVPARRALMELLQARYGTIAALNTSWETEYADFEAIQAGKGNATQQQDLKDFMKLFADTYFAECSKAMDRHFPNHLDLGCRFHVFNPILTAAASRHCDVVSVNVYRHTVADFRMVTDQDRPLLISEFHFGTRDYGTWGTGLTGAADARNQADLYQVYLSEALRHPNFVGAHWFQWSSQPATGRRDGENFGVGLVSVVDRPVPGLVDAVRRVSNELYEYRLQPSAARIGNPAPRP